MFLSLSFVCFSLQLAQAQNVIQPYGKVDQASMDLKECPFEKDANAMVLFDKGRVYFDDKFDIIMDRHRRIKIFNEKSKDKGNIRIEFYSLKGYEKLISVQAQTINLKDGKIVITKLNNDQKFTEQIDKYRSAIVFSMPDVQAGSVIEYRYTLQTSSIGNFPSWRFQSNIPVGYSELSTSIPDIFIYKPLIRVQQAFFKNLSSLENGTYLYDGQAINYTKNVKTLALKDVPSIPDESFMTCESDNLQSIAHQLSEIRPVGGFITSASNTWGKIGVMLGEDEDFGLQFKKKLEGEQEIIAKAVAMKSQNEKIAYLFNTVRDQMKWNSYDSWYTNDGIAKAWQKKAGNSTEVNLILYRLLVQSGVKEASPMIVSTRSNGKVFLSFPWLYQFNRTAIHIPIDSTRYYLLDATEKSNQYNVIPSNLLNNFGLLLDKDRKNSQTMFISTDVPSMEYINLVADIKPDGKMTGMANLHYTTYHRSEVIKRLLKDGEAKEKDYFINSNNTIKVDSLQTEDNHSDSLYVKQHFNFDVDISGSDDNYIFFTPNLFCSMKKNPFLNENRKTMIDMGFRDQYNVTGAYSIPSGFKADVLPKSLTLLMTDRSISFKRVIAEQDNKIFVRYLIEFKKSIFTPEEYPELRQFYKQMFDMWNEQIVLKKI